MLIDVCHIKNLFLLNSHKEMTDLEPPKIDCPDNIHKTSKRKWTKISFPGVTVTDNVGVDLFTTSKPNGSDFTWGEHNVTYAASDLAGNTAQCHFQVIIVGMYRPFFYQFACLRIKSIFLEGLGHAILGNFSTDQMVIE